MGAQPKNKVTRVEQGKRRAGNKPKLAKDYNTTPKRLSRATLAKRVLSRFGVA